MSRFLRTLVAAFALAVAGQVHADVLTTLYTTNANANDGIAFNLQVAHPNGITITGFDVNANTTGSSVRPGYTVGSSQSLSVYYKSGTFVGFNSVTAWTWLGNFSYTVAAEGSPSFVSLGLTTLSLSTGNYALALGVVDAVTTTGAGLSFNNGNGTAATPGSGSNQTFGNVDLTLLAGNSFGNFSGTPGSGTEVMGNFAAGPRVFNGSIYYDIQPVPEPTVLALFLLAAGPLLACARRRR
jgi:hypothetical protein